MIKIDANLIKCEMAIELGIAILWLQNQASAEESWVWILEGVLLCLPCCHKIGSWKAMGECNVQIALVGTVRIRVT